MTGPRPFGPHLEAQGGGGSEGSGDLQPIWQAIDSLAAACERQAAALQRQEELLGRVLAAVEGAGNGPGGRKEPLADIVGENQAVERLRGMGKGSARRWLRRERLSVVIPTPGEGRKRDVRLVIWGDVLERLRRQDDPVPVPTPERRRRPGTTSLGVPGRLDAS